MKNFSKAEKSWIMYDWANSVYATIIMAAIFPIYFSNLAANLGISGDVYWGYATSAATLIVAVCAPFLGAIGDFKGMKIKLFRLFLCLGVLFTLSMAITNNIFLMLVGYCMSYVGFSCANIFYDSFLTDVSKKENMDKVSAYGFAMGYIGGSTIAFLFAIALIMFGHYIGIGSVLATKLSIVLTSLWWAVFSIPMLKNVHQKHYAKKPERGILSSVFSGVRKTFLDITSEKKIFLFMIAYFFYIDGVNTIIHMATSYGSTLGLDSTTMILALLVTQLVAVPCSIIFSSLSSKFGTIKMLLAGVCIYIVVCLVGFYMGFSLENASLYGKDIASALRVATILFWLLSILVGTAQGGIQALSRSYFGQIIPPERSSEFFGFFDIFGKFAAVIGPILYATSAYLTGRSSIGIISIILLFILGGIFLILASKQD